MLNHHQMALCKAFQRKFDKFCLVVTENREAIGYQMSQDAEFVLHYYDLKERKEALNFILAADVVIFGGCPDELIHLRMKENKLSFLYTERFFKKGVWRRFIPRTRKKIMERIGYYKDKNMYVLCASAYTTYDLSFVGYPVEKCFKWGYFPETKQYDDIKTIIEDKHPASILWAARFIEWKHPELPILVARRLKEEGYSFELNMIGSGSLEPKLLEMIKKYNLQNYVHMRGAMQPEKVREYMEQSRIFLFTSDQNEGWGAVANEAMNSGCAVVANHVIGSVPFLIQNKENGLIYQDGKFDNMYKMVKSLLENPAVCYTYGERAYKTIVEQWNAENAANSFFELCRILEKNENVILKNFMQGPCSPAVILKNNWFR